ncbi:MAG: hypothetical protein ACLGI9_09140, partial [Thermoanaerobaculia bacterium]
MNRSFSRNLVLAAALMVMTFTTIPSANAGSSKPPALKPPIRWFETSLSLFGRHPARTAAQLDRTFRQKRKDNTWGGTTITAHTGA